MGEEREEMKRETMNPTKTTPCPLALPLRVVDTGRNARYDEIHDADGGFVAQGATSDLHALVTAANALPGLVEAARFALFAIESLPDSHDLPGYIDDARNSLQAALKAAGEGV
jgi:hypothetical protein